MLVQCWSDVADGESALIQIVSTSRVCLKPYEHISVSFIFTLSCGELDSYITFVASLKLSLAASVHKFQKRAFF